MSKKKFNCKDELDLLVHICYVEYLRNFGMDYFLDFGGQTAKTVSQNKHL